MKGRWSILLLVALLAGCEVIDENNRLIPVSIPVDQTGRGHVLIEFTGFRCVNCPNAADVAEQLHQTYGEQLIVVAMHPASNPFTQGAYDYTCAAADTYYTYMGGSATTPFPTGNIDMLRQADTWLHDYPEWPTLLAPRMKETTNVHLTAQVAWQESTRELTVNTTTYADLQEEGYLITWLVEDSIEGVQAMPNGDVNMRYYHRHVLRAAIGDPWGEQTTFGLQPATQTAHFVLPEAYRREHCSVVVVATDNRHEIRNARQIAIQ